MDPDGIQRMFLEHPDFDPEVIDRVYPNARRVLKGGVFVSHSGLDYLRVRQQIVFPVVAPRFGDGFFLHNRGTGAAEKYRDIIQAALSYCDYFLLTVSRNSLANGWVRAEVNWASTRRRPIVACLLDETSPSEFRAATDWRFVDFRSEPSLGQSQLALALDALVASDGNNTNGRAEA